MNISLQLLPFHESSFLFRRFYCIPSFKAIIRNEESFACIIAFSSFFFFLNLTAINR